MASFCLFEVSMATKNVNKIMVDANTLFVLDAVCSELRDVIKSGQGTANTRAVLLRFMAVLPSFESFDVEPTWTPPGAA